jgi:hypothetical protein
MVSAWLAIVVAIGIAVSSFSIPWAQAVHSNGYADVNLTPTNMASAVGDNYGPCGCPIPTDAPPSAIQDVALNAIAPALVSATFLAAGAWLFPLAFLLAFVSLLKWKVMIFSGILFVAAGASWIIGIATDAGHVNAALALWVGQPEPIGAYFGPYLSVLSGVILATGYLLVRRNAWSRPMD